MKTLKYTTGTVLGLLAAGLFMSGVSDKSGSGVQLVIGAVVVLAAAAGMFAWAASRS